MGKSIISLILELCLYNLSKPHSGQRSGGPTASTLNIISVSFSCGGSIVLMSGRDNKSDILFILYLFEVLLILLFFCYMNNHYLFFFVTTLYIVCNEV